MEPTAEELIRKTLQVAAETLELRAKLLIELGMIEAGNEALRCACAVSDLQEELNDDDFQY